MARPTHTSLTYVTTSTPLLPCMEWNARPTLIYLQQQQQQLAYLDVSNVSNRFQYQTCVDCMRPHGPKCRCKVGLLLSAAGGRVALEGVTRRYIHLSCHLVHDNHRNSEGLCQGLESSCLLTCKTP